MSVFGLLVAREARLLFRRPAELANPLVFFAIVVSLFPLAVGPESQLLQTLSPDWSGSRPFYRSCSRWTGFSAVISRTVPSNSGSFRRTPCLFWFWPRYWHTGPSRVWHWFCSLHCWR